MNCFASSFVSDTGLCWPLAGVTGDMGLLSPLAGVTGDIGFFLLPWSSLNSDKTKTKERKERCDKNKRERERDDKCYYLCCDFFSEVIL